MMKTTNIATLILFIFFQTNSLSADDTRYYDIEIVIFQNVLPNINSSEEWPSSMDYTYPENALFIGDPYPGLIPSDFNPRYTFKPVIKSNYKLTEEAKLLDASQTYRVLYHRAWRQPGLDEKNAIAVKIRNELPPVATRIPATSASSLAAQPIIIKDQLFGTIKIVLKRYLHVDTDLYLKSYKIDSQQTINADFQAIVEPQLRPVIIDLKESRKMRSKEVHYLDNPVLGMLIYITPFDNKS